MGVALIRVLADLERDRPRLLAGEGDGGGLVHAGADQVEVVDRGLVLDLDRVLPRLERLHVLAALLDLDREAWADLAGQLRCACESGRRRDQCGCGGERDQESEASGFHTYEYSTGRLADS